MREKAQPVRYQEVARGAIGIFLPLFALMIIVAALIYFIQTGSSRVAMEYREIQNVELRKKYVLGDIESVTTDLLFLAGLIEQEKSFQRRGLLDPEERASLSGEFLLFAETKKLYDQVRLLDEKGMEIVRVNFKTGFPAVVPELELQNKRGRYYFDDTFRLGKGEVYVSAFDLNIEHGHIEQPVKPMIRFGTSIFDENNHKRGIVLLNYLGANLLHKFSDVGLSGESKSMLLNSEGYYLKSPRPEEEWGFMYKDRRDRVFGKAYPAAWRRIGLGESGQFETDKGSFAFTTVYPILEGRKLSAGSRDAFGAGAEKFDAKGYKWKIVSHIPADILFGERNALMRWLIVILSVFAIILGGGAWRLGRARVARLHSEEALREGEEKYRALYEESKKAEEVYRSLLHTSADAIVIYDIEGKAKYINPSFTKTFGWTLEEVEGKRIPFLPDAEKEAALAGIKDIIERGKAIQGFETRRYTKDGRIIDVDISGSRYNDHEGKPAGMLVILRDTSERKALEAQLQQTHKMEAIGTLAGGIAHDFNNILGIIVGHTDLALDDVPEGNRARHNLREIRTASLRARDFVKLILAFSRQSKQEMKPIRLTPLIKESLELLRSSIPTTIEIRRNISSKSDTVNADPSQISQVLLNLFTNSAHAMGEKGGVLDVGLEDVIGDEEPMTQNLGSGRGKYVKLTVSDTGHGIEPEIIERIFDPFFTTKEVGEGSGMGLSVAQRIIKSHGGAISVNSRPGKGATFQVFLPITESDVKQEFETIGELPRGNERILFVDDDKAMVDVVEPMLERLGYEVTVRTNSIEALEAFRNKPDAFDLVVTDQTMPNMTGVDLSKELRLIRPDIPVILCTGYSDTINEESAGEMGISTFAMKPLMMSEIARTIRKAIDEKER